MTGLCGLLQVREVRESFMRTILLSALALGALTSTVLADGPLVLTDKQMDGITAGKSDKLYGYTGVDANGDTFGACCFYTKKDAKQYADLGFGGDNPYKLNIYKAQ
jgi:hypothetical protein